MRVIFATDRIQHMLVFVVAEGGVELYIRWSKRQVGGTVLSTYIELSAFIWRQSSPLNVGQWQSRE